jgi:hypothetical protein
VNIEHRIVAIEILKDRSTEGVVDFCLSAL